MARRRPIVARHEICPFVSRDLEMDARAHQTLEYRRSLKNSKIRRPGPCRGKHSAHPRGGAAVPFRPAYGLRPLAYPGL
jgi:hypothetical protein